MAQNTKVTNRQVRYTRADLAALRAYLQRLPIGQIAMLYYTDDDLEVLGCINDAALRRRLETLRDRLVSEAALTNVYLAETLHNARRSGLWTPKLADFLVKAGESSGNPPQPDDSISAWLRPRVAKVLLEESVQTLADLMQLINMRGNSWWKPVRCIGQGKARCIESWLKEHQSSLGQLCPHEASAVISTDLIELSPGSRQLVPLERIRLPSNLNGSCGFNRATLFCQISARNDLEAAEAYLYRFRGTDKTQRAYRKELERFLLWCVIECGKPMSSVLHDDCEAYKDFLTKPGDDWIGPRTIRRSLHWKPFAGIPSVVSQRYAIQVIRTFFTWLVNVRYLAGNPWLTVSDPRVPKPISPLQIEKALPSLVWEKLCRSGGILDQVTCMSSEELSIYFPLRGKTAQMDLSAQFRLAKAVLLLLGHSGLRREEAASATRNHLRPVANSALWELDVLGKRNKWRTVFLPLRVIDSLKSHWKDRGLDFSFEIGETPLLSPLFIPLTKESKQKHLQENGRMRNAGFSPDGLYRMIRNALRRIAEIEIVDLDVGERRMLCNTHPHVLRHMFGTQAAAAQIPLDVLQRIMGHASLQTTTIYIQTEKRRSIEEMGKFFLGN